MVTLLSITETVSVSSKILTLRQRVEMRRKPKTIKIQLRFYQLLISLNFLGSMISYYTQGYHKTQSVTQVGLELAEILLSFFLSTRITDVFQPLGQSLPVQISHVLEIHAKQNEIIPSHDLIIYCERKLPALQTNLNSQTTLICTM